jgi:hypothetical protein
VYAKHAYIAAEMANHGRTSFQFPGIGTEVAAAAAIDTFREPNTRKKTCPLHPSIATRPVGLMARKMQV